MFLCMQCWVVVEEAHLLGYLPGLKLWSVHVTGVPSMQQISEVQHRIRNEDKGLVLPAFVANRVRLQQSTRTGIFWSRKPTLQES